MRSFLGLLLFFLFTGCGAKSDSKKSSAVIDKQVGISAISECKRATDVIGSPFLYEWETAPLDHLQSVIVDTEAKIIKYVEAKETDFFEGEAAYRFENREFFFRTTSKSLKLSFPAGKTGRIKNQDGNKEYIVSYLAYDDGSGYKAYFLCSK